jgi:large subunit ribosomal protein L4
MKFTLYTSDASKSSEVEISNFPTIDEKKGERALKQYLVAYSANQRLGTASTKSRHDLKNFSGKKIYAQKGTGRSRHGDKTAPQFYHGAVAFGPHPRKYTQKVNEQTKQLAFTRALVEKASAGSISLIERFDVGTKPATRKFASVVSKIAPKGKVLVLDDSFASPIVLSARNLERIVLGEAAQVNAFDLIRYKAIVVSQKGFEKILTRVN